MRLASSCTVMVSGRITSRTWRTWSERSRSSSACRRSRSRCRRTLAIERVFSSSPSIAACTSMRPDRRPSPGPFLATTGVGARRIGKPPAVRRTRPSSSSRPAPRRSVEVGVAAGAAGRAGVVRAATPGAAARTAAGALGAAAALAWPSCGASPPRFPHVRLPRAPGPGPPRLRVPLPRQRAWRLPHDGALLRPPKGC